MPLILVTDTNPGVARWDDISTLEIPVQYGDTMQLDAFGRLRTSESNVLLDSKLNYDLQPLLWESVTSGGGSVTHDADNAAAVMSVPAAAGAQVIRQTRRYWQYRAGQSLLVTMTSVFGEPVPGVLREQGFGDDNNGVFFRQAADGTLQMVIRSYTTGAPVETVVPQSSWNLDKLDGTGASGLTLDISAIQIFFLDIQWLGAGRVRVGFNLNGVDVLVHQFLHSNLLSTVYMSTGVLPVRYRLYNDTGASAATMSQVCSSVVWEGGEEGPGYLTSVDTGVTSFNAGTTLTSLLAIRLRASHIRANLKPVTFEVVNQGNQDIRAVLLLFNPGSIPAGLAFNPASGDASEFSVSNVAVTEANGYRIASEYVLNSTGKKASVTQAETESYLRVAADKAGVGDVLVLAVRTDTNNSLCLGALSYKEFY